MRYSTILSALLGLTAASPCPFGQMAERGELSAAEAKRFYEARAHGERAVEAQIEEAHSVEKREEHARQEEYYKRQLLGGLLTLGGGLLGGLLQPFTGKLSLLEVPLPQPFGLKLIPGNDPKHQYVKPTSSDVRGMCPTLNTMANHGYIAHNGITTFKEAAEACQITLGFGYDTCVFLSGLGLLTGGDLVSGKYSIGGADVRVPNTLGPSLGISKHGFFEVDNSISRIDAYAGNQANFHLDRFNQLVKISQKYNGEFNNAAFAEERVLRYNEARATNPQFNAGIRWLAVTTAERVFIFRALPNGTFPDLADFQNVGPFYLNETFPENWFRRATPYSLVETGTDIVDLLLSSPELTIPGENQGLNNFVPLGLDIRNSTANDLTCFLLSSVFDELPGFIVGDLLDGLDIASAFINGAILPFFAGNNCPITAYSTNGPSAGTAKPGVSTNCNVLVNGVYKC